MKNNIKLAQEVVIFPDDKELTKSVEQSISFSDNNSWVNIIHDGNEFSMSIENFKKLFLLMGEATTEIILGEKPTLSNSDAEKSMLQGVKLIAEERIRQIEVEGWTDDHDDRLVNEELADAAASYALSDDAITTINDNWGNDMQLYFWPFDLKWLKRDPDNRIKDLVKAGALIAAEIDRLHREIKSEEV